MTRVWFALVVAMAGCGGDDGAGVALEDQALRWARAFCQHAEQCCDAAELADVESFLGPTSMCGPGWLGYVDSEKYMENFRELVAAGQATYDPALGAACVLHIETMSCEEWSAVMNDQNAGAGLACVNMFGCVGEADCEIRIPEGEACDPQCEDLYQCSLCKEPTLCDGFTGTCSADAQTTPTGFCDGV